MIVVDCVQGTEVWHAARCGVITASKFRDAVEKTAKGKPTSKSSLYAAQVAIERISGIPCDEGFNSWQMRKGQEREPMGRMEYESRTGNLASESGVVLTDDRVFGYSTDGFINEDGGIEIKSLSSAIEIINMWRDQDLSEYMHQIQGGMWITGRKWIDFIMYAPQLQSVGKQLFVKRVFRDDNFIDEMVEQLILFSHAVDEHERVLRATNLIEDQDDAAEKLFVPDEPVSSVQISVIKTVSAPVMATAPTLRLGQIGERLGFSLTADFLR